MSSMWSSADYTKAFGRGYSPGRVTGLSYASVAAMHDKGLLKGLVTDRDTARMTRMTKSIPSSKESFGNKVVRKIGKLVGR